MDESRLTKGDLRPKMSVPISRGIEREKRLLPTDLNRHFRRVLFPLGERHALLARVLAGVSLELMAGPMIPPHEDLVAPAKAEMEWLVQHVETLKREDFDRALKVFELVYGSSLRAWKAGLGFGFEKPTAVTAGLGCAEYAARILDCIVVLQDPARQLPKRGACVDSAGAFIDAMSGAYRYWSRASSHNEAAQQCRAVIERLEAEAAGRGS